MRRITFLIYGFIAYIFACVSILYLIGFVGNIFVPKSIDTGLSSHHFKAILINIVLLAIFIIQHNVMARETFKRWLCRYIPEPTERSTFSLLSSISILLVFWQWRPMTEVIWSIEDGFFSTIIDLLFFTGWFLALYSTFMIDHFHLFGLRQDYLFYKKGAIPPLTFKIRGPYKYVRYPVLLGFLIALFSTSHMTVGHLLFSLSLSFLIINGIRLKDKDFLKLHPKKFSAYKNSVNAIIPINLIMKK